MGNVVCSGAVLSCSFGSAPSTMSVLPANMVYAGSMPAACISDYIPLTNIMSFGTCSSLVNPTVASATSAAQGVLTPMPCIPATAAPWTPGNAMVSVGTMSVVTDSSKLICSYGGSISVTYAGQVTLQA